MNQQQLNALRIYIDKAIALAIAAQPAPDGAFSSVSMERREKELAWDAVIRELAEPD